MGLSCASAGPTTLRAMKAALEIMPINLMKSSLQLMTDVL
jgi:hypothetical protein